ncbi:hypothetical protein MINTM020_01310 [Mycobacterium paraintracellulare]|uniref:hypothetical protein n=1 Tax=Mycobacterium paraintracellulare TaxID=1138383 RepID=UPI001927DA0C|nr:hypothetical protein [Mycobacterium paraintracellulare]BCP08033.1 hypothetical protein MINTM020_01310 [Mycobacterium paraintracellulare]
MIRNGTRLRSQVCDTHVIVVKANDSLADLRAGGTAMVPLDTPKDSEAKIDPSLAEGNQMGKRYVDESGAEVLVTRPGAGTLSIGDTPMLIKEARPLPASD